MTEVTGVTTAQIDQAGDDYAYLLEQALDRAARAVARRWSPTSTEDDLAAIRTLWLEEIDRTLAPTLALLLHTGAAGVRSQLRTALTATAVRMADIPPVPHHLTDAYLATAADRLQGAGDLLWEAARDQLREGVAAGESHRRLATRIRKATGFALPRARVIARTEARDALLAGSLNQVRATGLTGTKTWVSVRRSPRTRPEHKHAHGQTVDLRDYFTVGGWPMDRPHDDTAPAEAVVNCRCGLRYSLDTADVLLGPTPERAPADDRLLRQVWAGGMVRAGVTVEQLARLLEDLGLTAAAAFHLAGKHDQKRHGKKGGQISRAGMGDLALDEGQRREFAGGSATAHMVQRPDGSYGFTPERQALHDEIVNAHLQGKTPADEPVYNMLGGGPGSGKSTLVRQSPTLQDPNTVVINPDDIKDSLPEYRGTGGKNNTLFVHEESSYLGKRVQAAAFERRYNVTFDGVGDGSPPKLRGKVDTARAAGYRVNGQYVTIPTDVAIQRAELRGQRTGRFVPEPIITELHTGVSVSLPQAYSSFDSVDLFDNRGEGPLQHVMEWRDGTFTVHDPGLWDDFVAKGAG